MSKLYVALESEIKEGKVTDVYFERATEVARKSNLDKVSVAMEAHTYSLPTGYEWAVLGGIEEVAHILDGKPVDVYTMEEGTIFRMMEPIVRLEGNYISFGQMESAILGILRHSTSIMTKAAKCRMAAGDKTLLFFGIRCVHPAIAPMVDRSAFIGGCDAVSDVLGAKMINEKPVGTMPHAMIITFGDQVKAWKAFNDLMPPEVPRIALCDTWFDERVEAVLAAESLGDRLFGVRLDTPGSRRGNMRKIVMETRWALKLLGRENVKIFVSGGIDEADIKELSDIVDGFGVGTSIAFPPSVDIALDIVEVNGQPRSKKGKLPGRKQVYRCDMFHDTIVPWTKELSACPKCNRPVKPLLKPLIKQGKIVAELPSAKEIREKVMLQLKTIAKLPTFEVEPAFL
ncbi:MAG: nicotinate phosphoribosyltransferase [Nitrososphaerota archaeon]|nr:nicotinate phosphoribosyltransferase [Aigarchaeota archaeon]MDW8076689.1 nicotinate phosphoribosyltransferase [Nitrososphaerota archaeon]